MTRFLAVACAAALVLGCSGKSESDGAGTGGSAGTAGGAGGAAGKGQGGTATAGAGALAGRAGAGGSGGGSGHGGASGASSGSGGTSSGAGGGGSGDGGASGRAGGSGGAGAIGGGAGDAGRGGDAGAAGESGAYCGGMLGTTCPTFEYCDFGGLCTLGDASGVCRSSSSGSCGGERVCGCDGKIYANDCRAHSAGVDITDSSHCVTGNGDQGNACVVDDDCTGELKCCSSPIGVVSCTPPMGNGCPLTP